MTIVGKDAVRNTTDHAISRPKPDASLKDHALFYAGQGWPVFPCRGKHPLTQRGCRDATTDPEQVARWWARCPDANIGFACGVAGISVVDIDVDADKRENGHVTLQALEFEHGKLAPTLMSHTPRGGAHYFFRSDPPPANKNDWRPGIDIRGDGYYVILPPSISADNGKAYKWEGKWCEPALLPDWLRPENDKPKPDKPSAPARPITPPVDRVAVMDRARAYLACMDIAIEGAGGHDRLFAAATALVHGFMLSDAEALDLLWNDYNPQCLPPWDRSDRKQRRDFERKVTEARKVQHDHPQGWLLDDSFTIASSDAESGRTIADALIANAQAKPSDGRRVNSLAYGGVGSTVPTIRASDASKSLPARLLEPPGAIGQLVSWINATAFKPQPSLALANALSFWGAVVGRKVRDERDLRTNIYSVGVAHSGAGKDHSRKCIKRLCQVAGIADSILAGEDIASDSALLYAVGRNPSCLFQLDEIGHYLLAINSKNAAPYAKAAAVTLTKLYSSASTIYLGKEYADKDRPRADIDQPNACLYGTTVPSTLYEGITPSQIRDGFLGRILVFHADDNDPDERDEAELVDPPGELVDTVKFWIERRIDAPANVGNIRGATGQFQITVPTTTDASQVFRKLRSEARSHRLRLLQLDAGLDALWSRAEENARKVALIIASGISATDPSIDASIAAYACDLVRRVTVTLIDAIGENVSETPYEHLKKRVMTGVHKRGGNVTQTDMGQVILRGIKRRERDEVLADLVQANLLRRVEVATGGRPAIVFQAV